MASLRLYSWNVNGIRSVYKKGLLGWLQSEAPDVLCLQEIKATVEQVPMDLREIPGYYTYYVSAERKGYSGVATLTKIPPGRVQTGFDAPEFDNEGRVCMTDLGAFMLFNVYFPNGRMSADRLDYKLRFYDAFLACIDRVRAAGRNVVVCGDVNTAHKEIDLARPKENERGSGFLPQERAWIDRLIDHGYVDTFRLFNDRPGQYTWWDQVTRSRERNVGWRIDYFFVNEEFVTCVKKAWIMPEVLGSDHCPIGLEVEIPEAVGPSA